MNKIIITGRLTKDVELRYTKTNKKVCEFSVAVTRDYKNEKGEYEVDFINVQAWGYNAEYIASYCKKGDKLGIDGSLRHEVYETDKGKRNKDYILAEKVEFMIQKKDDTNYEEQLPF